MIEMSQQLKWICTECQHYVTDHISEDILKDAAEKGFSINPYIGGCRECDCMMFERADVAPDDKKSAEYIKEFNSLIKEMGLRRA